MTTSNLASPSSTSDNNQHSQFDIYPQKLLQTEQRLFTIEDKLKNIIQYLSSQRKIIQTQRNKEEQSSTKINEQTSHQNIQRSSQYQKKGNSQARNAGRQKSEGSQQLSQKQKEGQKDKQNSMQFKQQAEDKIKILKWLQFWAEQDQIFLLNKQNHEKTIAFYEQKMKESEKMYKQMRQFYLNKIRQIQKVQSTIDAINSQPKPQLQKISNPVAVKIDLIKQKENVQKKMPDSQLPQQYNQIVELQNTIKQLSTENTQLQDKLKDIDVLSIKNKYLQDQILSLQNFSENLHKQIDALKALVQQKDQKIKEISDNLSNMQEKLHGKQKQLLKAVHSESNFAAQQLINLEAALIRQKQQSTKDALVHTKKIQELQQTVRQLNFNSQKDHIQIGKLKEKIQQQIKQKQALKRQIHQIKATQHNQNGQHTQIINIKNTPETDEIKQQSIEVADRDNLNEKLQDLKAEQQNQNKLKTSNKSCNSVSSYMKKSIRHLKISHQVQFQHKIDQNHKQQSNGKQENKTTDIFDILFDDEGDGANQIKDQQFKFTKVVSVKSNEPYDASKSDQDGDLNMDILGEILLIPVDSLDQIEVGLEKLKIKLIDFKRVLKQRDYQELKKDKQLIATQENSQENWNKALQNELKITGFPGNQKAEEKEKVEKKSTALQKLNKDIYELAHQFGQLCKAVIQNFEDQVIKCQSNQTIQKIQNENKIKQNQLKAPQKINNDVQIKKQEQGDIKKQKNLVTKKISIQNQNLQNEEKKVEHHPVLESREDYNKILKVINGQIKKIFTTFFNDSKILNEEDQSFSQQHIKQNSSSDIGITQLKQQDEKSILDILSKIQGLQSQLQKKRTQIFKKNKQRVQRLFDVIRSMIITFKISYKAMDKIIVAKQLIDGTQNKYMLLRHYLTSLYKIMEQQSIIRSDGSIDHSNSKMYHSHEQNSSTPLFTLYDNYEQKIDKLSSQLSKVRLQLDYKNKQFEQLKQASVQRLQIPQADNRSISKSDRDRSRKQSEEIAQLNQKFEKNLNSEHKTNGSHLEGTQEDKKEQGELNIKDLKNQLQVYKRKCLEYQQKINQNGFTNINGSNSGKKKTQKIIYIRK